MNVKITTLFIIVIWAEGEFYSYAIAAENLDKAAESALNSHAQHFEVEKNKLEFDREASFDVTVAHGQDGQLYDVLLNLQ